MPVEAEDTIMSTTTIIIITINKIKEKKKRTSKEEKEANQVERKPFCTIVKITKEKKAT